MANAMSRKQRQERPSVRVEIKKNDIVRVIAGRDKGKEGRVLSVDRRKGRLLVEHVMMVKRHTRPNPSRQIKGGIAEREGPIAVSSVMIVCAVCGPVRIAHKVDTARRTRVCRKCGAPLDRK
jgi:large subunit ribosomal protein L24